MISFKRLLNFRNIFRVLKNNAFDEYQTLLHLSRRIRIKAAAALLLLYSVLIVLLHLAIYPSIHRTFTAYLILGMVYACFMIGFFGGTFLTLFFRRIRKHRKTVNSLTSFIGFAGGGFLIGFLGYLYGYSLTHHFPENFLFARLPHTIYLQLHIFGILFMLTGLTLYTQVLKQVNTQRIETEAEINVVRRIQQNLVPEVNINDEEFCAYGKIIPAREVGGDYLEFRKLEDGRMIAAVGDVSGHDLPAGLLMGMTKSAFFTELKYNSDPALCMESLNQTVFRNSSRKMFVTWLFSSIYLKKRMLQMVSAGHLPLLIYRAKQQIVEEINTRGLALGLIEKTTYSLSEIPFTKDDILFFFTDGLIEATNHSNKEFGLERLKSIIKTAGGNNT
ncbi:MAG: PP2C family protein-serine/threonine phosphatase, partial [Calditrichia bacterium]